MNKEKESKFKKYFKDDLREVKRGMKVVKDLEMIKYFYKGLSKLI